MATETLPAAKVDFEAIADDIRHRAALAQWIEEARRLLHGLYWAAQMNATLKAALQEENLAWSMDWTDVESAALTRMMAEVEHLVGKLVPADREEVAHG